MSNWCRSQSRVRGVSSYSYANRVVSGFRRRTKERSIRVDRTKCKDDISAGHTGDVRSVVEVGCSDTAML